MIYGYMVSPISLELLSYGYLYLLATYWLSSSKLVQKDGAIKIILHWKWHQTLLGVNLLDLKVFCVCNENLVPCLFMGESIHIIKQINFLKKYMCR